MRLVLVAIPQHFVKAVFLAGLPLVNRGKPLNHERKVNKTISHPYHLPSQVLVAIWVCFFGGYSFVGGFKGKPRVKP